MQIIECLENEVIFVGNTPVGIVYARDKGVRLAAPSCISENEQDLRVFMAKQRRNRVKIDKSRHRGENPG